MFIGLNLALRWFSRETSTTPIYHIKLLQGGYLLQETLSRIFRR